MLNEEEGPLKDEDGNLIIKLSKDDSALVVHANGGIELISTELNPEDNDSEYIGDIEDLNKTFSLVLALAASLENEDLYNRIFHNLNAVLMKKWDNLPDTTKENIKEIRNRRKKMEKEEAEAGDPGDLDEFYKIEDDFLRQHRSRITGQNQPPERKIKKRKRHPLAYLKNVDWNTKDESLVAHWKEYQVDTPPPILEDE